MPEVLIANDDITVLGPPEVVELLVDVGPTGQRGSRIFVGVGEPNTLTSSGVLFQQTVNLYDMYINSAPGANYGYMYQYKNDVGGDTWVQVLRISPTLYSKRHTVNFVSGEGAITVPISQIVTVSGTPLTAANFNIQYSIESVNPIASSLDTPTISGSGENLLLSINAVKYQSSTWSSLAGEATVHLFISIVI